MHKGFNSAMEAKIEVIFLIGKLTYLKRQLIKLEIEKSVIVHQKYNYDLKRISAKKEKLKNDIEDLEDDIAYLINKFQRYAKDV